MSIDDLAVREFDTGLAVNREPEVVLEEAHRAAAALKRVLEAKPNKVMFGGEQYLEYEDWQTVGRFYGIAPRNGMSRPLTIGDVSGWEATADAVHVPTGRVVSSADAMCMNDEEKWRARPKYEWYYVTKTLGLVLDPPKQEMIWEKGADGKSRPKKERVHVGEESVPSFQLRSMAQTRAAAKALRNALAWVVVLAGYRPTPAEELPTTTEPRAPTPRAEDAEFTPPAPPPVAHIGGAPVVVEADAPLNEELERSILLAKVKGAADKLGWKADKRAAAWDTYCQGMDPRAATLEALNDLYAYLLAQTK